MRRGAKIYRLVIPVVLLASLPLQAWSASNDPLRVQQYGLDRISAEKAWPRSVGAGATIAVIDTGVDSAHEDLRAQVLPGHDFVDSDGLADDRNGHGTHVAGIAAAAANNGVGISGVAPDARILPLRVLDGQGIGTESDVASAIRWAISRTPRNLVINLSLTDLKISGSVSSTVVKDAIADAWRAGAVVIAAAGNEALPFSEYPAEGPNVISVGATDSADAIAPFSNKGVNIVGPGDLVVSTFWDPQTPNEHNVYASGSGTSMAAPHVSGVAALLLSSGLSNSATVERLLKTADDLGPAGRDPQFGFGRVNAARALGLESGPSTSGVTSAAGRVSEAGKFQTLKSRPAPHEETSRSPLIAIAGLVAILFIFVAGKRRRPGFSWEAQSLEKQAEQPDSSR